MQDTSPSANLSRRSVLRGVVGAGIAGGLAGCLGGSPSGTVDLRLADESAAIDGLSQCTLTVVGLQLRSGSELPADPGIPGSGVVEQTEDDIDQRQGRRSFQFGDPQEIDLTEGGGHVFELEIETGVYEHIQLRISGIDAVADGDGPDTVVTPIQIGTTNVVQIDHAFELEAEAELTYTAGVRPVRRDDRYVLLPVAESTAVA